jgi:hypothetical protein
VTGITLDCFILFCCEVTLHQEYMLFCTEHYIFTACTAYCVYQFHHIGPIHLEYMILTFLTFGSHHHSCVQRSVN